MYCSVTFLMQSSLIYQQAETGKSRFQNYFLLSLPVDITCYYNGFHGDLNETLFVGDVDDASKELVKTAYECMMAAINESKEEICI